MSDYEDFAAALKEVSAGGPDDEFGQYHMDSGNLYALWGRARTQPQATQAPEAGVDEAELQKIITSMALSYYGGTIAGTKDFAEDMVAALATAGYLAKQDVVNVREAYRLGADRGEQSAQGRIQQLEAVVIRARGDLQFLLRTGAANMTMEKANKATAWMDAALGQKEADNG